MDYEQYAILHQISPKEEEAMSTFAVKVFSIIVEPHPDPETERLECARIGDYRVVVEKGHHSTGDKVAYIPEDSLMPENLITAMGLEGKLAGSKKDRVKAVKLRGQISQGLVWPMPNREIGDDVAAELGITKYEPPLPASMSGDPTNARGMTLEFDIESFKLYPHLFNVGEEIVLTKKIHGAWTCMGLYESIPIVTSKGLSAKGIAYRIDNTQNPKLIYHQQ